MRRQGKQALSLGLFKWTCQNKMLFVCVLFLKCSLKGLETVDDTEYIYNLIHRLSDDHKDRPSQRLNQHDITSTMLFVCFLHNMENFISILLKN